MNKKISFRIDGDTLLELESYKKGRDGLTDCLKRVINYGGRYRLTRIDELSKLKKSMEYWNITPDELIDLDEIKRNTRIMVYQDIFTRLFTWKTNKKDLKIYLQEQIQQIKKDSLIDEFKSFAEKK